MHNQRLTVLIFSILGGIGSMGPWLTAFNTTVYGYAKPDGWAMVFLFGIVLITVVFGGFKTSFGIARVITHTVLSAGAAFIGIYTIIQITDNFDLSAESVSMGWGLPVVLVSAVVIPIAGYLMMEKTKTS